MTWVIALAAIFGLLMAFGIGANDAANSWGTTVGSGALGLRFAILLGGVMELAGAMSIGYGVAKTIKGVASVTDPNCFACGYCNSEMGQYSVAMFSALIGASYLPTMNLLRDLDARLHDALHRGGRPRRDLGLHGLVVPEL